MSNENYIEDETFEWHVVCHSNLSHPGAPQKSLSKRPARRDDPTEQAQAVGLARQVLTWTAF
jgi:hypothetical protein